MAADRLREHQDVTYCRCPSKPEGAGVADCPTREGASDNLAPGSAGGTTVNKEGGRVGGRHKGMAGIAEIRRNPRAGRRFDGLVAQRKRSWRSFASRQESTS